MKVGIGYCNNENSYQAGIAAAEEALKAGCISRPDFSFAFVSGKLDHEDFFHGLRSILGDETPVIGGSAIGVITNNALSYSGFPAAISVIQSDAVRFTYASESGLNSDEKLSGSRLIKNLAVHPDGKVLLIFYDSVKTPPQKENPPIMNASSPLIEGIEAELSSGTSIFGAGLLSDFDFTTPIRQFCGTHVKSQSVVGTMVSGDFTPYFNIMHGCSPLDGVYHIITKIDGPVIYEIDNTSITDQIDELYGNTLWRHAHPVNLLTIGINYGEKFASPREDLYVNRLIAGALPDGKGISLFEPDLKSGTKMQFMLRDSNRMISSARRNTRDLVNRIQADGKTPLFALYIDCAGRAAEYSNTATEEASEVQRILNKYEIPFIGFYSGVEIAPFLEKSRGLDWTGVLLIITE